MDGSVIPWAWDKVNNIYRKLLVDENSLLLVKDQAVIDALSAALEASIDTGVATGGSNTTIVDTGKSWAVNMWVGATFEVTIAGVPYLGIITSNTANTITIPALAGGAVVVAGSAYALKRPVTLADISDRAARLLGVLSTGTNVIGQVGIDQTTLGSTNRVDAQLSGLQVIPINLFEWTSATWIATQALTVDGVQLSDEKTQAVGGAEAQVFGAIFEPPKAGSLVAVQLGLTCQLKSGEATAAKTWQWKARNKAGTWVNLHGVVSENLTTAYVEKYRSGVFYAVTNFNAVPFEVGLFCTPHAATALATIISQVKSSSMGIVVYRPS